MNCESRQNAESERAEDEVCKATIHRFTR
jgi:hypothetical protein